MSKKMDITKAAAKVFAREGYHNTKVQMIADELQVSVGTIYNYFKSKEEILQYIFQIEYERRLEFIEKVEKQDISPLEKLRLFLENHFDLIRKDSDIGKVMFQEVLFELKITNACLKEYEIKIITWIKQKINQCIEIGLIEPIDVDTILPILISIMRSTAYFPCDTSSDAEFAALREQTIKFIIGGLGVRY